MERGLLWLPLLAAFVGLAWAGWHEYQKVQAYQRWAAQFDRSKYDIRAVLGQVGPTLTWGRPTRQGPVDLIRVSLLEVDQIRLQVDGQLLEPGDHPRAGRQIYLHLGLHQGPGHQIPFTEVELASRWQKVLQELLQTLKSASNDIENT
ncbi:MAG: hypothetical protein KGQ93_02595 [Cyanobacteria bacterium REEB459]|nr:hypothetical protein [Cyanobacteria bacterium REEB459]